MKRQKKIYQENINQRKLVQPYYQQIKQKLRQKFKEGHYIIIKGSVTKNTQQSRTWMYINMTDSKHKKILRNIEDIDISITIETNRTQKIKIEMI